MPPKRQSGAKRERSPTASDTVAGGATAEAHRSNRPCPESHFTVPCNRRDAMRRDCDLCAVPLGDSDPLHMLPCCYSAANAPKKQPKGKKKGDDATGGSAEALFTFDCQHVFWLCDLCFKASVKFMKGFCTPSSSQKRIEGMDAIVHLPQKVHFRGTRLPIHVAAMLGLADEIEQGAGRWSSHVDTSANVWGSRPTHPWAVSARMADKMFPFAVAARNGQVGAMAALARLGGGREWPYQRLLCMCLPADAVAVAKAMLAVDGIRLTYSADDTWAGFDCLTAASRAGNIPLMEFLMAPKAQGGGGFTANHFCLAEAATLEAFKLLLRNGADVNGGDDALSNPLMSCLPFNKACGDMAPRQPADNRAIFEFLLDPVNGADVNKLCGDSTISLFTSLLANYQLTQYSGEWIRVKCPLFMWMTILFPFRPQGDEGGGADGESRPEDEPFRSPTALLEHLVTACGARVNTADSRGRTALLHAREVMLGGGDDYDETNLDADAPLIAMARTLLSFGYDPTIADDEGQSPAQTMPRVIAAAQKYISRKR